MEHKIVRFEFGEAPIKMPKGAVVVGVSMEMNQLILHVEFSPAQTIREMRQFITVSDNDTVPANSAFIGAFIKEYAAPLFVYEVLAP